MVNMRNISQIGDFPLNIPEFRVQECHNRPFRLDIWVCSPRYGLEDHVSSKDHNGRYEKYTLCRGFTLNNHVFRDHECHNQPFRLDIWVCSPLIWS